MSNMMNRKPAPIFEFAPKGSKCSVCGKLSYSANGIHPQCAMVQADAPRKQRLAAERRAQKDKSRPEE
jgi:hypothetical protein